MQPFGRAQHHAVRGRNVGVLPDERVEVPTPTVKLNEVAG